ncbi:MAG: hypothetical protein WDM80_10810 [Limisphaerales bacterium]
MTPTENAPGTVASLEQMQKAWPELTTRIGQLESDRNILEQENKSLRSLLERVIEHRQKSHGELVLLLTNLVSKLPIGDVGFMVSKLVEHNNQVSEICNTLSSNKGGGELPLPAVMKIYEQNKRDLTAAIKPAVEELIKSDAPLPEDMLRSWITQPKSFFSPASVRATRCFLKKQLPRARILQEFGEEALVYFTDLTTDPKLNPRPKPDEIVLSFKPDAAVLIQQDTALTPEKRQALLVLHQKVQKSKEVGGQVQKNAFLKLSCLLELLNYYENQGTESPDVIFAQRLPSLIEQLVIVTERDQLDEKVIQPAETLLNHIINNDHRLMVVNNMGKAGGVWRTLRYVLLFRMEKISEMSRNVIDFVKHLVPTPQAPRPEALAAILRLILPDMQALIVRAIISSDRLNRNEAESLSRAVAKELGLKELEEVIKAETTVTAESASKTAWENIQELIASRADPAVVTAAVRTRLHANYNADEVKLSWITLTATDPMSLVRTFCQLPYLADGTTDPVARAVMESYVSRLMHEKYADIYTKVVKSLTNMFKVKPDSPTLVNFLNLLKWVDAEAEKKMSADIGIHATA